MKTWKKTICCFLAAALLITALTACGKNGGASNGSADISTAENRDISAAESTDVDVSAENSAAEGSAVPVTERRKGRLFVLDKGSLDRRSSIYLNDDGTYTYSPAHISSYIGIGTWTKDGTTVTLTSMAEDLTSMSEEKIRLIDTGYALIYVAEGSVRFTQSDVRDGDIFYLASSDIWDKAKYSPDYNSTSTLRADEFLEKLKTNGYHVGDTMETGFNTKNIEDVFNITPAAIAEENADLDIFCVYPGKFCFFMYKGEIYRYDTTGGYHHFIVLWDYDGNGVNDLVSYDTFGSGIPYLGVFVTDLTTMERFIVYTRNLLSEPGFSFDFDGENIYLDGEKLTYSDGEFGLSE